MKHEITSTFVNFDPETTPDRIAKALMEVRRTFGYPEFILTKPTKPEGECKEVSPA